MSARQRFRWVQLSTLLSLLLQGYYVDADGNCAACTLTGCAKCASPGGDTCEQCVKGFFTPTDDPATCANCTIAQCEACTGATTDPAPTCAQVGRQGQAGCRCGGSWGSFDASYECPPRC